MENILQPCPSLIGHGDPVLPDDTPGLRPVVPQCGPLGVYAPSSYLRPIQPVVQSKSYEIVMDAKKDYLDKNSQAVKKGVALFKNGQYKKSCEIQAGSQEKAVMVG